MRWLVCGLVPLLAMAAGAQAQPETKPKPDQPPAAKQASAEEEFAALIAEVKKIERDTEKAFDKAQTNEERQKVREAAVKKVEKLSLKFLALAKKFPKDREAIASLAFIVGSLPGGPVADEAVDLLLKNHADKLGSLCEQLAGSMSPAVEKLLRGTLAQSKNRTTQAVACFSLAQYYKNLAESEKGDEAVKLNKEAEKYYLRVTKEYADLGDLAEQAKGELFELQHLSIGKVAPEIKGSDADGKEFKLSDYRGKVVILDFWATW